MKWRNDPSPDIRPLVGDISLLGDVSQEPRTNFESLSFSAGQPPLRHFSRGPSVWLENLVLAVQLQEGKVYIKLEVFVHGENIVNNHQRHSTELYLETTRNAARKKHPTTQLSKLKIHLREPNQQESPTVAH
jgi:hypothetical protein